MLIFELPTFKIVKVEIGLRNSLWMQESRTVFTFEHDPCSPLINGYEVN